MNILQVILISVGSLLALGFIYQSITAQRDKRRFPPPGHMVDIGGRRLHLNVMGEDKADLTVILDAGMVSFSSNWGWVQPEIAKVARVVAVDRAGLGWSDPGPKPCDAGQSARDAHTALEKLGIAGPYVLVGHSYGGITIRAFTSLYRDEVAGMVLVDGSHPDQWVRMGVSSKAIGISNYVAGFLARFGVFRIFNGEYKRLAGDLPAQQYAELMAIASSPRSLSTGGAALLVWDDISRHIANDASDLGDLPLVVLSVTEQPLKGMELTGLQAELPTLSTNSEHITVQGANHEGLVSQQKHAHVVTEAILCVINRVRSTAGGGRVKEQVQ